MKKTLMAVFIVSLAASLFILGVHGSGVVTRKFDKTGFSGLDIGYGMNLTVTQGAQYLVQIKAKDNIIDLIEMEQQGERLKFTLPLFTSIHSRIDVLITMPMLTTLYLRGGSTAAIMMDSSNQVFSADLSGGSGLSGSLQAQKLLIKSAGGGRAGLTGQADSLEIRASGGSRIQLEHFPVKNATIDLTGGSTAKVIVSESINVSAAGGSQLFYRGNPRLGNTSFSGGSSIQSW